MFQRKSMLCGLACCLALATTLAASAVACERTDHRPILVSVGADGMPAVDTDSVTVCEGDTVRWVFKGAARVFAISFTSAADSPFDWGHQTGATVTGTVKPGAAQDGQPTSYKYDVKVDGKTLDPKIIVVP
jgi:plastocyanin